MNKSKAFEIHLNVILFDLLDRLPVQTGLMADILQSSSLTFFIYKMFKSDRTSLSGSVEVYKF